MMRTRFSTLFLALCPCLISNYALAENQTGSVVAIQDQLLSKHSELEKIQQTSKDQQATVTQRKIDLAKSKKLGQELDEKFRASKKALESSYQQMIDDPSVDIAAAQATYQQAWKNLKQNQNDQLQAQQHLVDAEQQLITTESQIQALEQEIAKYNSSKIRARVERLKTELQPEHQISVSFTNRCQSNMTLAQCDIQTRELALQKAVKTFQSLLIDQTTESELVKKNIHHTSLNIHIIRHKANKSEFYDGERYRALIDATLEARPSDSAACTLLGVDKKYCYEPGYVSGQQFQDEQEIAWVTLSVHSNQYDDQVFIDGVAYGSTPVDVMLPIGQHYIEIKKEGFKTFSQYVAINSDRSFKARLTQKANILKSGEKFADSLGKDSQAPQLVTVVPGEYMIGENASNQYFLDHAFGIGATPITVGEFDSFVRATDYQTDAELKNTCAAIENGEVTAIEKRYWRNPGFKQGANSPVVCVSRNDAQAYAKWLSQRTGFQYRLPTEDEWEIAARAGSQADYWWGQNFISGDANTGWSSSPWANTSTSPVRAFKANPLGIYDAVGNVWQWTNSPQGVAKGGAWNFSPEKAVAYERLYLATSNASNYVGFRVIREIN